MEQAALTEDWLGELEEERLWSGARDPAAWRLEPAELARLRPFRLWLLGLGRRDPGPWTLAWRELSASLGASLGHAKLRAVERLATRLAANEAPRRFRYHAPCCGYASEEEAMLLSLFRLVEDGKTAWAETLARHLSTPAKAPDLLETIADYLDPQRAAERSAKSRCGRRISGF